MEIIFNTNGTLLTENLSRRLVDLQVDQITFSFDSGQADIYQQIRKGAHFDRVVENMARIAEIKRSANQKLPLLGISFVPMVMNVHTLPPLIDLCRQLGMEYLSFETLISPTASWDARYADFYQQQNLFNIPKDELIELFRKVLKAVENSGMFLVQGNYIETLYPQGNGSSAAGGKAVARPTVRCTQPWTTMYINAEGAVHTCCMSSQVFGNLKDQEISEIWNGKTYRFYREKFLQGLYPPECEACVQNNRIRDIIPEFSHRWPDFSLVKNEPSEPPASPLPIRYSKLKKVLDVSPLDVYRFLRKISSPKS